jgi:hypothetical protein
MSDVADVLRKARDLYAANPSHADLNHDNDEGTYCVLTATEAAAHEGDANRHSFPSLDSTSRTFCEPCAILTYEKAVETFDA